MLSVDVIQWRITLELCTLTPADKNQYLSRSIPDPWISG